MAKKSPNLDPAQVLAFPFQDQAWITKFLIAGVLVLFSFIPVIPAVLLLGYGAEIIRRVAVEGEPPALPEWDDLSGFFNSGLRLFGVSAVYLLPATLLIGIGYLSMFIPVVMVDSGAMSEAEGVGLILAGYIAGFGLMGTGAVVAMLTGLVLPIAASHAAATGDFQAAFRFGDLWEIFKANWGGFVLAYLILIGLAMVLYYGAYVLVATVILCCLYPIALCLMSVYLLFVGAGLFGSAYQTARANLGK